MRIFGDIEYGTKGKRTVWFGKKEHDAIVKSEYTVQKSGSLRLRDFKVQPFKPKGKGHGTKAYKLFEKSRKEKEIIVVAGHEGWSSGANKDAYNFWKKMGFKSKVKWRGRPVRMTKKFRR